MGAPFRFLRAAAVTAAMFSLAAGAHALGGGVLPAPPVTAAVLVLTLAPVMALTGMKLSAPLMAGLLGTSQLALHEAFERLSVAVHFASVHAGHTHGTGALLLPGPVPVPAHAAGESSLMLLAHAAATLATALLLARGEAALWALAAWLRPLAGLPEVAAVRPLPRIPVAAVVPVPSRWRSLALPALRGPPAPAAS